MVPLGNAGAAVGDCEDGCTGSHAHAYLPEAFEQPSQQVYMCALLLLQEVGAQLDWALVLVQVRDLLSLFASSCCPCDGCSAQLKILAARRSLPMVAPCLRSCPVGLC
jgi:hypothetical protein